MKLAGEWKARMSAVEENSLEVLGFLQLLVAFKLASAFCPDEIQSFLGTVSQHRQAPELRQALGNAKTLSGKFYLMLIIPKYFICIALPVHHYESIC